MTDFNDDLEKWFEELQEISPENHLLCPKISRDDHEDYKTLDSPDTSISLAEKKYRIEKGQRRIEVTYWNSLIFGFDKKDAGKWLDDFTKRLEDCLRQCPDCVINWHMQRKAHLQKFSERWDDEAMLHIEELLDKIDVARIDHNLTWARQFIENIEASGATFKKAQFGEHLQDVLIAVYEALCCIVYIADPDQRHVFQYVFMRLQGKSHLKLGNKDPLPGMTYFLFDPRVEDRFKWARENCKVIDSESVTEEQFDWAVRGGLIKGIDQVSRKDLSQPTSEDLQDIERFWEAFEDILRILTGDLILNRLSSLEVRQGSPNIYELLFRHIQFCRSEGVLVVTIRVLNGLLTKSPKAIWDVIGDARPNVIADLFLNSPVYKTLLRQSLEDCWGGVESGSGDVVPFPTSWIHPWLQSMGRDRRYDACEVLMHNLFETLAKDDNIGEPGQAACVRAGFDALSFTLKSFLDPNTQITSGTTHLYASATFNLVVKYKDVILRNFSPLRGTSEGWTTFKIANVARALLFTAMRLDTKLYSEEFSAIHNRKQLQLEVTRKSKAYWECVVETFDESSDQVGLATEIMVCLGPLIAVEQIRPRKTDKPDSLSPSSQTFNKAFGDVTDVLVRILGRVSELDAAELNMLFTDRLQLQVMVGLTVHGVSDVADASVEVLKGWTGELSRDSALEHMARLHPEQTLSSLIWSLERVMRSPFPWGPIRPLLNMSRSVLRGLVDSTAGVLRTRAIDSKLGAIILRWWNEQWRFVSRSCLNIENWSQFIQNAVMTDFCREIMELAEALIAEDGLLTTTSFPGRPEKDAMVKILEPAKDNFRGMENMIRLKDRYLVDVTVRVLCKILKRLRENGLEINAASRKLITDACVPTGIQGKYLRSTNLNDQQRAELLQALGHDDEIQIIKLDVVSKGSDGVSKSGQYKKQSRLDVWSKSAPATAAAAQPGRTNRDDVLELSKSADSPLLKQIGERQAKAKVMAKVPDARSISALKESRKREKAEKAKRDAEIIARARQLRGEARPGEGSGAHGLSLTGKDVSHGRSEIMVNSSEEDSDGEGEDSDADAQLAALSTGGQKSLDEHERQRQQALRDRIRRPVKKARQQRSVKEMRARLIPPMDRLHNTILAWDIFHQGNDPPSGPAASEVATKYPDPRAYQETFFPLLASEAWRSFVTSKNETTTQPFGMKTASRASVDSYLEATFTLPTVQGRERLVSEGDILLVSEAENPLASSSAKHCLARVHRITYKKGMIEVMYRVALRNNSLSSVLTPGVSVHGIKITNMATIEREYAALESLQYYDLMDEILKAEPSPILRYGEEKVAQAMQNWALNQGQALAVLGAHDNDGFTLIQGPPGTGKTKTIVAMVGSLLSDQLGQASAGVPVGNPLRPTSAANGTAQARPKKLLVCAPSNAAVDELVLRLKAGIKTTSGKTRNINVLRLGRTDVINAAVKDVTLDEQVRLRLEGDTTKENAKADREKLHEDAAKIKEELALLRPRLEEARGQEDRTEYGSLSRKFEELKRRQFQIGKQIDANKDSGNSIAREMEMRRRQVQQEILNSAHVLCATLSGSGHEMFRNLDVEFETVIIDEAAQCVELSALIPLKYGCCKCILVGDPKQLPPTVLSQSAARFGYDQSLFVRMQQNHPDSVHLLNTQYRMHPEISMFPSKEFYEGQLQDGQGMMQLRQQPWHGSALLGPYRFFDVEGIQERGHKGQSLVNIRELEVALQMYDTFSKKYRECDLTGKIGIITPYKAQLFELRRRFQSRYGEDINNTIEFNTTDAFQGRECEIIIFSCVRASATGGIGFMTDIRRMNVGLTRAKSSLWILGDSRALVQGEFWRKLIEDARARDRYTTGDIVSMFRRPLEKAKPGSIVAAAPPPMSKEMTMSDAPAGPAAPEAKKADGSPGRGSFDIISKSGAAAAYDSSSTAISKSETAAKHEDGSRAAGRLNETVVPRSSGGPPVIHTGANPSEPKKRGLENPAAGQPGSKRVAANAPGRGGGLMAKFGQKSRPPAPKDPSAMSVLGMTPPERPPARAPAPAPAPAPRPATASAPSASLPTTKTAAAASTSLPSSKTPPAGPRKKGKPSLFLPKKR